MLLLIEDFLRSFAGSEWFNAFNFFMHDAYFAPLVVLLTLTVLFLIPKKPTRVSLLVSLLLAAVLVYLLKLFYADPRPCAGLVDCESGFGFPSGHSTFAFTIATHTFGTKYFYAFLLLAVLIALSRVVAGVHSFLQIVGGAMLGFVVSTSVNIITAKFFDKKDKKRV
ncbi:MAG: phosphatase PAP2 family protein [Candidatus Micrarchaeota archaeon]|nr:phosphatase PAP2 family protein [Candidatus Micrarchaeota archaeon]